MGAPLIIAWRDLQAVSRALLSEVAIYDSIQIPLIAAPRYRHSCQVEGLLFGSRSFASSRKSNDHLFIISIDFFFNCSSSFLKVIVSLDKQNEVFFMV